MSCEAVTWYRGEDRRCNRVTAVRRWYDEAGTLHVGCGAHYGELVHRFPEADAPMPSFLHDELAPDPIDEAKWTADRAESWTLA